MFLWKEQRYMPTTESIFRVRLPVKAVWSFMSDRREVGCLFPGCKGIKVINDLDAVWNVRVTFGPFAKTVELKTHTTFEKEFEQLSWIGSGDHIHMSGDVLMKKVSDDVTEVVYRIEGHVTGPFAALQDIVVAEKLREVTKKFIRNIRDELEWQFVADGEK
jgi:carbon monoxide dehydrogenase subunit G